MRAYVTLVTESELRWFLPEDSLPGDLMHQLIRESSSLSTAALWAVLGDEDAEAVRAEVAASRRHAALGVLLDRAVEIHAVLPGEDAGRHSRHQP
jgi:hypothetical protein